MDLEHDSDSKGKRQAGRAVSEVPGDRCADWLIETGVDECS